MNICIVGPGKLGTALALLSGPEHNLYVLGIDPAQTQDFAERFSATVLEDYDTNIDLYLFALDPGVIIETMGKAAEKAKNGALLVNLSTKSVNDSEMIKHYDRIEFIDMKMIGSAIGVREGLPTAFVLEESRKKHLPTLKSVLPKAKEIFLGDVSVVARINSIGSTEGIRAGARAEMLLEQENVPQEYKDMVLQSVLPGTLIAYTRHELGEFASNLAKEIKKENLLED